ncbi:MarR family winged helix-turn-helix transcriptional regulator [Manganibacter manganicus]|nr:MarR family transcriptional regulator [Pseudaminobacter manganicus]
MTIVSRKMRTLFNARVLEHGLTLARARTLLRIAQGGAANQKELAEELEIETATLVRLIDGLEAQGLIERCKVEGDRRAKQAVLTREGVAKANIVDGMVQQIRQEVLSDIEDADLKVFHGVLKHMAGNLEAAALVLAE